MTDDEIDLIAGTFGPIVKELIAAAVSPLALYIAAQDAKIAVLESRAQPVIGFAGAIRNQDGHLIVSLTDGQLVDVGPVNGKDGRSPETAEIAAMVSAAVASEVVKIEPAPPGRDCDAADVAAIVMPALEASLRDFAALTIAALPKAENGRDADPAVMVQAVTAEVTRQMAAVRVPKDGDPGKDAAAPDPEVLRGMIVAEIAALPPPKDGEPGKDADPAEIAALLRPEIEAPLVQRVTDAIAAIPELTQPKDGTDGRDVDAAEVAALLKTEMEPAVRRQIAEMVDALPPAKAGEDGKNVEVADVVAAMEPAVRAFAAEWLAALPPPKNGADADPAETERLVAAEVTRQIALVPPAKDGADAKLEDIAGAVAVEVARVVPDVVAAGIEHAVAELPRPQDGHSPTEDEILPLVARTVDAAVAALPKAKDGEDAKPEIIAIAVAEEFGRAVPGLVAESVERAVAGLPKPQDGHTPTEDEMRPLVVRVVDLAVAALPKPEPGKRGASVMDAEINADGQMVLRMSDARNVVVQGKVRGDRGKPGTDGKDGDAGRDAIEITIRPGIDETRSYAPGIYAAWRGGVIGSVRQTDPIEGDDIVGAGWIVVQNGVAQEVVRETDDGRTVERVTSYTNGQSFTHRTKTATPIYRGVWHDGRYERGDMVTHGGSLWHCDRDTDGAPEQSRDWTLSAKRGRDGKETVKLPPPPRGPVKL